MRHRIAFSAFGNATSLFLAILFASCVGFDLLFPAQAMYQAWQKLLPGFEWISWKSFLLGLAESFGYGWYVTLIWVPIYNVFTAQIWRQSLKIAPAFQGTAAVIGLGHRRSRFDAKGPPS